MAIAGRIGPADTLHSRAVSQAGIPLDQHGLCQHRDCISHLLYHWTNRLRPADGSRWHKARPDDQCAVVLDGLPLDVAGEWHVQFCGIPLSTGSGRVCQLAGGEQGCIGVVSEARAGTSGGVLRQWVFGWRRDRSLSNLASVLALGMARGICDSWCTGIFVAHRLAAILLPAAGASTHQQY